MWQQIELLLREKAATDEAAKKQEQEREIERKCALAADKAAAEMKEQLKRLQERLAAVEEMLAIEGEEMGTIKKKRRKRPKLEAVDESEEEEDKREDKKELKEMETIKKKRRRRPKMEAVSESEEEEDKEAEKKEPKRKNKDKDSLFKYEPSNDERGDEHLRINYMHELLWRVTLPEEFEEWCGRRLKEQSERAKQVLKEFAAARNMDVVGKQFVGVCKSQATLVRHIAQDFAVEPDKTSE
jgi:hypothetical protein